MQLILGAIAAVSLIDLFLWVNGEFGADHRAWAVGESILLVLTAVALVLVILRGRR